MSRDTQLPGLVARRTAPFLVILEVLLVFNSLSVARAQAPEDTVRGVVREASGKPVAGASVIIASDHRQLSTAVTDSNGTFMVVLSATVRDTAGYTIHVIAPQHMVIDVKALRLLGKSVYVADVRIRGPVNKLRPVIVAARRRPPLFESPQSNDAGAERDVDLNAVSAVDRGDIFAALALVPGVAIIPGDEGNPPTFSVLGLSGPQNRTVLNGVDFAGTTIPQGTLVSTRLATSSFDPSVGGFSGGQLSLYMLPGGDFQHRTLAISVAPAALERTDPTATRIGLWNTDVKISGVAVGALLGRHGYFNTSAQIEHRSGRVQSLLSADGAALESAGLTPAGVDSVSRTLRLLGLPSQSLRASAASVTDKGAVLGRFDLPPTRNRLFDVVVNGNWQRTTPFLSNLSLLDHGTAIRNLGGGVQLEWAQYTTGRVLNRLRAGSSLKDMTTRPLLELAEGRVFVGATLSNGEPSVTPVQFGGYSGAVGSTVTRTNELYDEVLWNTINGQHQLKLATSVRVNDVRSQILRDEFGSYSFNSLADLAAGKASSFTHVLAAGSVADRSTAMSLSLGDQWRIGARLRVEYGVRIDESWLGPSPGYNPLVDSAFNLRTNAMPRVAIEFSPRFGFVRSYGVTKAPNGQAAGPAGAVRGGFGVFQSTVPAELGLLVRRETGLSGADQRIACVGGDAPTPIWTVSDATELPQLQCAAPLNARSYSDMIPPVRVFDKRFTPPLSLRYNLGWSGGAFGLLRLTADAIYSRNLHQLSTVAANFGGVPRFSLGAEGGRPVFIEPTHIIPSSGATDPTAARSDNRVGSVTIFRSDLHSESRQFSVGLSSFPGPVRTVWQVGYAYSRIREETRGFDGTTAGDPREVSLSEAAFVPRHALSGTLIRLIGDGGYISIIGRLRSGLRFTPLVLGDVNGDGLSNDRAYVFDPSRTADSAIAQGMRYLLRAGDAVARTCLDAQLGRIAGRNSCEGPWAAWLDASVGVPGRLFGLPRVRLRIDFTNVLAGVDELLHGSHALHGWGQTPFPDPVLLTVRGFDPVAERFSYVVNPYFGETRVARSSFRSPFRVSVEFSIPLSPTPQQQELTRVLASLRNGGGRLSAEAVGARYSRLVPDPLPQVLAEKDSLALTPGQARELAGIEQKYHTRSDSIWMSLANYLVTLDQARLPMAAAMQHATNARLDVLSLLVRTVQDARLVLSREQIARLPIAISSLLDPAQIRSLMADQ